MDYDHQTDEQIIENLRRGDTMAQDFLLEKYKGMVRGKARTMHLAGGGDTDDLIQEGMIGLFKAIRDYEPDKSASFATFANLCVGRQIYTAVQASGRKKNRPLNEAVSIDEPIQEDSDQEYQSHSYSSSLISPVGNPEEQFIDSYSMEQLTEQIRKVLSPFERKVMELYLDGQNPEEIAAQLGRSRKSIDNALQRSRSKISRLR